MELTPTYRSTHDLSIEQSPNGSCNKHLAKEGLPLIMCDFFLSQFLHHLHASREAEPKTPIIISKVDVKSACRLAALYAFVASICITKIDEHNLLILRMSFGFSKGPHDWLDIVNEPETLDNDLINCPE